MNSTVRLCGRELFLLQCGNQRDIPQQHLAIAAVRIVAIDARSFDRGHMLAHRRRFVMASRADLFFRHREADGHHVALGCGNVTYGTSGGHRRVHRLPYQLVCVARRALGILGDNSRMLNCPRRATHEQHQAS